MWKDIGVDVIIDLREGPTMIGLANNKTHAPMTILANSVGNPHGTLWNIVLNPKATYNLSMVNDPELIADWRHIEQTPWSPKLIKELNLNVLAKSYFGYVPTPFVHLATPKPYWPWVENY